MQTRNRWVVFVFIALVAVFYLASSFAPVIFDETEGQYAGAAREMLQSGQWLVPTNDGLPRLQKPPLLYWLLCLSLGTLGQTEFAARLPNALATIGWIWGVYLIGERVGGPRRGLAAAGIFGSMIGLFIFSHLLMPEPLLGLFISLTFWCFLSAYRQPERARRWFFAAWLFMGLGVMSKGLHGALYPLLVALLSALFYRRTRHFWRGLWSPGGIAVFVAIVAPWYVAVASMFPGFLAEHFINEQAGHLFNKRFPPDSEPVPFAVFWAQHLLFFFPWTLFVPAAIWSWRQQRQIGKRRVGGGRQTAHGARERTPQAILWIWVLLTALSIMVSARQDYYTMTSWGAVAVWLALPWANRRPMPRAYMLVPCVVLVLIGAAGALWAQLSTDPAFAAPIAAKPVAARGDLSSSLTGFSFGAWRDCLALMKISGLAWVLGGASGALLVLRDKRSAAGIAIGLAMALSFAMVTRGYCLMGQYFSLADAAKAINQASGPDGLVVCEGEPHLNASLFFYLDRRVHWIRARADNEFATRGLKIGSDLYFSEERLAAFWRSARQVFLITESANLPVWQNKLGLSTAQAQPLARSGTRVVIVNH